jgi:hypothetical protein
MAASGARAHPEARGIRTHVQEVPLCGSASRRRPCAIRRTGSRWDASETNGVNSTTCEASSENWRSSVQRLGWNPCTAPVSDKGKASHERGDRISTSAEEARTHPAVSCRHAQVEQEDGAARLALDVPHPRARVRDHPAPGRHLVRQGRHRRVERRPRYPQLGRPHRTRTRLARLPRCRHLCVRRRVCDPDGGDPRVLAEGSPAGSSSAPPPAPSPTCSRTRSTGTIRPAARSAAPSANRSAADSRLLAR